MIKNNTSKKIQEHLQIDLNNLIAEASSLFNVIDQLIKQKDLKSCNILI